MSAFLARLIAVSPILAGAVVGLAAILVAAVLSCGLIFAGSPMWWGPLMVVGILILIALKPFGHTPTSVEDHLAAWENELGPEVARLERVMLPPDGDA